jgi:serine/threonine protein kinase
MFGNYIRLDNGVISEGDTGKVNWATNREQTKAFVIKEKNRRSSGRVDAEKYLMDSKFSNEAVMLPLLRQENEQKVTKVYEAGSTDLDQYLAGKRISPREAVSIVMRIAKGVRSLHEAGVVHGDIAPKNIIVSKDNVQLTDFDSSYVGDFVKEGASGNRFIMAPELFAFDKKVRFNESIDTYALGALLYFMLAGKWPHQIDEAGLSIDEKQHVYQDLHENGSIEFPSSIPEALRGVIEKAMSADPEERYVSADEFINAISMAY